MNTNTSTDQGLWTFQRTAGALMVAAILPLALGVYLFSSRLQGGMPIRRTTFMWERSSILVAVVLTALGFVLLEAALQETDGRVLARLGVGAYFFGAVLLVTAGATRLPQGVASYPLIVVHVLLAFLGQAAIGGALLQSNFLPAWIGWTAVVWNAGLPVVLLIITPDDIYYPIAHHLIPLLIGVPLLWRAPE